MWYSEQIKQRARVINPKFTRWEDKAQARFIAERFDVPVPKLYGIYDSVEDVKIPTPSTCDGFVIKVNNWAACYGLFAIKYDVENGKIIDLVRKKEVTIEEVLEEVTKYFKKQFTMKLSQSIIKPKILVEELLKPAETQQYGKLPIDYKCFVFGGKVKWIQVVRNRGRGKVIHDFMTPDWVKSSEHMVTDYFDHGVDTPPKPNCLDEIIQHAETLGKQFGEHLRVDMFATDCGAVFCEFTVQPASGDYFSDYGDKVLTELWDEEEKSKVRKFEGKKLCILTVVDKKFEHYIPLFLYCARRSYPQHAVAVFVRGVLSDETSDLVAKIIQKFGQKNMYIFQNAFMDYPYQFKTTACLRYLIPKECIDKSDWDYVHITDIDMMMMKDETDILEFHALKMEERDCCYSNTEGTWEYPWTGLARRLPALPTMNREWYEKVEPVAEKYRQLLKEGEVGLINCYDEVMLFKLVEQSGLPLPEGLSYEANYHGIHLGIWKLRNFYKKSGWENFLFSRIKRQYLHQCAIMAEDGLFQQVVAHAAEDEEAARRLGSLHDYVWENNHSIVIKDKISLALNMIVGPGEHKELERCLSSIYRPEVFDEVVIGVTAPDDNVIAVAKKYATTLLQIEWNNHFGLCRDAVRKETKSDFIMWVDADDTVNKYTREGLVRVKNLISGMNKLYDVFFIPYNLDFYGDEAVCSFYKERIFRNIKHLYWKYAVHEQLSYNFNYKRHAELNNVSIDHRPVKPMFASIARNVWILEQEYQKNPDDLHVKFYLMRDLLETEREDEGISILEAMIKKKEGNKLHMASVCNRLAMKLAFNLKIGDGMFDLNVDRLDDAEHWARASIALCDLYAEPLVVLGDIALYRGDTNGALNMYRQAMVKKPVKFGVHVLPYYNDIPALRLVDILSQQGNYIEALFYHKRLKHLHDNKKLRQLGRDFINKLQETYCVD